MPALPLKKFFSPITLTLPIPPPDTQSCQALRLGSQECSRTHSRASLGDLLYSSAFLELKIDKEIGLDIWLKEPYLKATVPI